MITRPPEMSGELSDAELGDEDIICRYESDSRSTFLTMEGFKGRDEAVDLDQPL